MNEWIHEWTKLHFEDRAINNSKFTENAQGTLFDYLHNTAQPFYLKIQNFHDLEPFLF